MKLTMHARIHFLLLIALGFLAACVSNTVNTVRIPDDLGQQGLLLVKLSSDNLAMFNKVQPQVNDKLYKDGYQDGGYVELVLTPGEYTFNSLMSSVQGGSSRLLKNPVRPEPFDWLRTGVAKSKGYFDNHLILNVSTSRQNPPLRSTRTVVGVFQQPARENSIFPILLK